MPREVLTLLSDKGNGIDWFGMGCFGYVRLRVSSPVIPCETNECRKERAIGMGLHGNVLMAAKVP